MRTYFFLGIAIFGFFSCNDELEPNKEDFDLSFIHQLLKRIQSEQYFLRSNETPVAREFVGSPLCCSDFSVRFDNLRDK